MISKRRRHNQAQHKYGLDLWRSIYYRECWQQPWQQIKRTFAPLQRATLAKAQRPRSIYRQLKIAEQHGQARSQYAA